jgi:hypothetical protein
LLRSGLVTIHPDPPAKRDKYRRLLVHLFVNGEDVGCILIREATHSPGAAGARIGASRPISSAPISTSTPPPARSTRVKA